MGTQSTWDSRTEASPDESAGQIDKMGDSKKLGFFENFMLAVVAAGVSKTVAAPIERVKLLVQNQDEMIKQGRLDKPYAGVIDCTKRVLAPKALFLSGEETSPTCYVTSPPRLSTLPSRTPSRPCSPPPRMPPPPPRLPPTLPPVAPLEPCPFCLCTPLTLPGPGWPTMPRARVVSASSTD